LIPQREREAEEFQASSRQTDEEEASTIHVETKSRRSRISSRRNSTLFPTPANAATFEEEEEEDAGGAEGDEDFVLPSSTSTSSRVNASRSSNRRKSGVLKEVQDPSEVVSELEERAARPSRRRKAQDVEDVERGRDDSPELEREPEMENVKASERTRTSRRRSILPATTESREATPEVAEKEEEEAIPASRPTTTTTSSGKRRASTVAATSSTGTSTGSFLLQQRKESIKREKEALKASLKEKEEEADIEVEAKTRRGRVPVTDEIEELDAEDGAIEEDADDFAESQTGELRRLLFPSRLILNLT
jgi:hypothetical protein